MKQLLNISKYLFLLFVIASCDDKNLLDENNKWVYADTASGAQIKLIHVYPSLTPAVTTGNGPAVFIYRGNQKLNGTAAQAMAYGNVWPASAVYGVIPTGNTPYYLVMNRVVGTVPTPTAGDTVATLAYDFQANKSYSIFLIDTAPSPKTLVVEDVITVPAAMKYRARFGNVGMNPTDTFDIYSVRAGANVATGLTIKQMTGFTEFDVPTLSDTFYLRKKGTTTPNISSVLGFSPTSLRSYTFFVRGKTGIATSRNTTLTFYTNR